MATESEIYGSDIAFETDMMASPSGDYETFTGLLNLKSALFRRLITTPGTLMHRPGYGVGIRNYQNSPPTLAVQREIALKIRDQFQRDPRVEQVLGIKIDSSDNSPQMSKITVRVKPVGYDEQEMNFIPFGE